MLTPSKIRNWRIKNRLAYVQHLDFSASGSTVLHEWKKLLRSTRFSNQAVNNSYIRFCVENQRMDLVDGFVRRLAERKSGQNLPAFMAVFDSLAREYDLERINKLLAHLPSFGSVTTSYTESQPWYQEANGHAVFIPPALKQSSVADHIQSGDLETALSLLRPTLFVVLLDIDTIRLRKQNAHALASLKDPVVDAFLKYSPAEPPEVQKPIDFSPSIIAKETKSVSRINFTLAALRTSLIARSAKRLMTRDLDAGLAKILAMIEDSAFQNDKLIEAYIVLCVRHERLDDLSALATVLAVHRNHYPLDRVLTLLKRTRTRGESRANEALEKLIPLLSGDLQLQYYHTNFMDTHRSAGRYNETPRIQTQSQASIARLLDELRFKEAHEYLQRSLFQFDHTESEFALKHRNLVRIVALLLEQDPLIDAYMSDCIAEHLENEGNLRWQMALILKDYYQAIGYLEKSKALLTKFMAKRAPSSIAIPLQRWMKAHLPAEETVKYFREWYKDEGSLPVGIASANALIDANRADDALDLLKDLNQETLAVQIAISRAAESSGDHARAFTMLKNAINQHGRHSAFWLRLISLMPSAESASVSALWSQYSGEFGVEDRRKITLRLCIRDESVHLHWAAEIDALMENFSLDSALDLLTATYARDARLDFDRLLAIITSRLPDTSIYNCERYLKIIFNLLYKKGAIEIARLLEKKYAPTARDTYFGMIKAFSVGDPLLALNLRSKVVVERLRSMLDREFLDLSKNHRRFVAAERNIAGELYNSFFFKAAMDRDPNFSVVCDERLLSIYTRNFPEVEFIPKTPRLNLSRKPDKFAGTPRDLCEYFDTASLTGCRHGQFEAIEVMVEFQRARELGARTRGWLTADDERLKGSRIDLSRFDDRILVGFAASSTLQSPIRNLSFVEIELWEPLFRLPGTVFVNLNPAFSCEEADVIARQYGIDIYCPSYDLFNDFESLIATMCSLDLAILPSNSLMDFAASVGLRTYVFSPSGMMKSWAYPGTDRYIFSEQVQFFFGDPDPDKKQLVKSMVQAINQQLSADS